jgi:predicted ATPase
MTSFILAIKRFKCFEELNLRIENLTVLTGKNSVGKSSITQAIRILREVAISHTSRAEIHLNGSGFQFGTYDEILNRNSDGVGGESFEIGISELAEKSDMVVFRPAESSDECEYVRASLDEVPILANHSSQYFTYLSAERYGPRLHQENTDGHRSTKVGVGVRGEFSAEVLANNHTTRVDERLAHSSLTASSGTPNLLLSSNLEKWMSTITGDIGIRASRPPRLANPLLEFRKSGPETEWQFPTNHGFGVSYTLPIVLAGLLLEENGFLIVDTPEAHLHPAAQTAIAKFLARVAACGRTVIIETHSDHIVDGFRLAIADQSHPMVAENCVFHYLDQSDDGLIVHHDLSPRPNGTLPRWPRGFFDQVSNNLRTLSQLTKKNGN